MTRLDVTEKVITTKVAKGLQGADVAKQAAWFARSFGRRLSARC